jgi:hypothetical protein
LAKQAELRPEHRKPQEVQRYMTDMERYPEIRTKGRILMGPGPSNVGLKGGQKTVSPMGKACFGVRK